MATTLDIAKIKNAHRPQHQASKDNYFKKNPQLNTEDDETSASSDDENGDLASPTPYNNTVVARYSDLNRHGLFSTKHKKQEGFFGSQHKLTAEEKKLLDELLELLGFNENEFKLKLQENHTPLKMFLSTLKKDMQRLHIPSPKDFPELCLRRLLEEKLLPKFLLEKPALQARLNQIELERNASFRPTPFSTRPKPPTGRHSN